MINQIKIEAKVKVPIDKVWNFWTEPAHITGWNFASDDWHCPSATNDLRTGGKFLSRMEAKDGSMGFDFEGIYDSVQMYSKIAYSLGDNRKVKVLFEEKGAATHITTTFDPEKINPPEMQKAGWQAILDNFKKYAEKNYK